MKILSLVDCCIAVACQGEQSGSMIKYFVGFVELPCLSASLGNVTQYKVRFHAIRFRMVNSTAIHE